MFYPLKFQPIFKSYVWGGRNLEKFTQKKLPAKGVVAESWEIVDRDPENSIVVNGPLRGKTLRWLVENHSRELLGKAGARLGRFPLLVKILDASEKLSLQVHPPLRVAKKLGGEPKTEMWYVYETRPGACVYAGLKRGIQRKQFETALERGTVEACLHRIEIKPGDVIFLPSGRVHAIGGNCILFEIQQNSDTTYRVYDWGRLGLDGKPRTLHLEQALRCIDFTDFEPALAAPRGTVLVDSPWFIAERCQSNRVHQDRCAGRSFHILCGLQGKGRVRGGAASESFGPGDCLLLPAAMGEYQVVASPQVTFLKVKSP